ncbi:MAG: hypothetical protein JO170_11825 [Verrucomicrobia bacterium]|nr:hypothetical protein [Verrucomicrobiota bacterium]HTD57069.1 hypothetical protein [Silvibacterium sp.]
MVETIATKPIEKGPTIIIDLGKLKRKQIKRIKNGEDDIREEVDEALAHAAEALGDEAKDKVLVPVVLIVEKKSKRFPTLPTLF